VSRSDGRRIADEAASADGSSGLPKDSAIRAPVRKRHWRLVVVVLVMAIGAATARLFIWPEQGMPARVSAIVMLDGPGDRLDTALNLAWQHRAPFVVISRGSPTYGHGGDCAPSIPHVTVICFDPNPSTTKGEAEYVGRLARKYHWQSIALVTITPQDSRGRLRLERCFAGPVYVVTAPLSLWAWPYQIAYEWGATAKALILQRSC